MLQGQLRVEGEKDHSPGKRDSGMEDSVLKTRISQKAGGPVLNGIYLVNFESTGRVLQ